MLTQRWETVTGILRRVAVWVLLLTCWETAYRTVGWRAYTFPAPSHVVDATLKLLYVDTGFGEDFGPRWPQPPRSQTVHEGEGERAYDAGLKLDQNPYDPRTNPDAWSQWNRGYKDADQAWYNSPLVTANLISAARLAVGFTVSVGLGTLLGLAMWRWAPLDRFLGPLFLGLQTLPSVCWVPLAVLTLGINEKGIMFVLVMGSFFAVAISMRDGLRTIPPLFQHAGLMMGARGWKLYRYVLLPASLPALAGSLRTGFSFAWRSLMGAELILWARNQGLGFLLHQGKEFNDVKEVVAVMIVMVLIGMTADRWAFARLQRAVNARFGLGAVG